MSQIWENDSPERRKILTKRDLLTMYSLLDRLEILQPNWLSVSTVKALVKSTIRLQEKKK